MGLEVKDLEYLDNKFDTLHVKVEDVRTELERVKTDTCYRLTKLETEYKCHANKAVDDASKKWKAFSVLTTLGLGILGFLQGFTMMV